VAEGLGIAAILAFSRAAISGKSAEREGVPLNQLINVAGAEKVSALRTAEYFQKRGRRADRAETLRILERAGRGNPPAEGDELPTEGQKKRGKQRLGEIRPASRAKGRNAGNVRGAHDGARKAGLRGSRLHEQPLRHAKHRRIGGRCRDLRCRPSAAAGSFLPAIRDSRNYTLVLPCACTPP